MAEATGTAKKSIWGVLGDVLKSSGGDGNNPRTPRTQPRNGVGRPKSKKPCGGCGSR